MSLTGAAGVGAGAVTGDGVAVCWVTGAVVGLLADVGVMVCFVALELGVCVVGTAGIGVLALGVPIGVK